MKSALFPPAHRSSQQAGSQPNHCDRGVGKGIRASKRRPNVNKRQNRAADQERRLGLFHWAPILPHPGASDVFIMPPRGAG